VVHLFKGWSDRLLEVNPTRTGATPSLVAAVGCAKEDLDLCFGIGKIGGTVLFVPQVSLVHYKSTSNASATRIEWYKARGFTQYFRKNFTGLYPNLFLTAVNFLVWC
jgi:GT2 family glycosyltransferase